MGLRRRHNAAMLARPPAHCFLDAVMTVLRREDSHAAFLQNLQTRPKTLA